MTKTNLFLSASVSDQLLECGYCKPNLFISSKLRDKARVFYSSFPNGYSNWGYHHKYSFANRLSKVADGVRQDEDTTVRDRDDQPNFYSRNIATTSHLTYEMLRALLEGGIASILGDIPLLIGNEEYLECSMNDAHYGFHFDPYSFNLFYQHMDDLSIYIPFVDMTEETGGRLFVQPDINSSEFYKYRHYSSLEFGDFCRQIFQKSSNDLITREELENLDCDSKNVQKLKKHILTLQNQVHTFYPNISPEMLTPITAKAGEVFLFNNRYYHWIEPMKKSSTRRSMVLRCHALYDIGLQPPSNYLNNQPCNQYVLEKESSLPIKTKPENIRSSDLFNIDDFG